MRAILAVLTAILTLALTPVTFAQPAPTRIGGTIESFDGSLLRLAVGSRVSEIVVPPDLPIGAVAERKLSDIRAGDYVGSAAVTGKDGRLHALEVHVFAESQRGVGEGHRPMSAPDRTMTNATVAEVAAPAGDGMLHLRYPGGEQTILVGPEVRVVAFVAGDRTLLKPGAAAVVVAVAGADGRLTARSIRAEKDGVEPPM